MADGLPRLKPSDDLKGFVTMVRQVANHLERGRGGLMAVVVVYPDGSLDGGVYCDPGGVPTTLHIASSAMLRQLAESMDKTRVPLGGAGHG